MYSNGNIKTDFREVGCEVDDLIAIAQDNFKVQCRAFLNTLMGFRVFLKLEIS
jgi:hypothetical protein